MLDINMMLDINYLKKHEMQIQLSTLVSLLKKKNSLLSTWILLILLCLLAFFPLCG